MTRLLSYVLHHDLGVAPCVDARFCSLAVCKFAHREPLAGGRPNVVELAEVGDLVVGTGGAGRSSAGHGRLVYAMRITEKMPLAAYVRDRRFRDRLDVRRARECAVEDGGIGPWRMALVSDLFWYFGKSAVTIDTRS